MNRLLARAPTLLLRPTAQRTSPSPLTARSTWTRNNMASSSSATTIAAAAAASNLPTPERCYVDFCLIPVGTGTLSVAKEIAQVQKLLAASGLTYTMHSAGTTVEGSWDAVMRVVGQAHAVVHAMGVVRIQSSMRVGTRTDKTQTAADKVKRVEDLLAEK